MLFLFVPRLPAICVFLPLQTMGRLLFFIAADSEWVPLSELGPLKGSSLLSYSLCSSPDNTCTLGMGFTNAGPDTASHCVWDHISLQHPALPSCFFTSRVSQKPHFPIMGWDESRNSQCMMNVGWVFVGDTQLFKTVFKTAMYKIKPLICMRISKGSVTL